MTEATGRPRGLAALSPERRKEIASIGGKAVPAEKRSFSRYKKLAQEAGSKGGKAIKAHQRSWGKGTPEAIAAATKAGKKGGAASKAARQLQELQQCARCKNEFPQSEMVPEEGDEWECVPCNDQENAREAAEQSR